VWDVDQLDELAVFGELEGEVVGLRRQGDDQLERAVVEIAEAAGLVVLDVDAEGETDKE